MRQRPGAAERGDNASGHAERGDPGRASAVKANKVKETFVGRGPCRESTRVTPDPSFAARSTIQVDIGDCRIPGVRLRRYTPGSAVAAVRHAQFRERLNKVWLGLPGAAVRCGRPSESPGVLVVGSCVETRRFNRTYA